MLGLSARTYTVQHTRLQTRLLITYYYILVPWTTPGTPVGQDNVRRTHNFTKYQNNKKTTKLVVLILVAILYQDVEDILGIWGSGRVVRLDCRW